MHAFQIILFLALVMACESHFSLGYLHASDKSPLVNAGLEMSATPDAAHVADLYARMSGMSPLLSSG